jgi:hypothetical protein
VRVSTSQFSGLLFEEEVEARGAHGEPKRLPLLPEPPMTPKANDEEEIPVRKNFPRIQDIQFRGVVALV